MPFPRPRPNTKATRSPAASRRARAAHACSCSLFTSHSPLRLDALEPRTLLFAWSPQEVYFAELVNRARANPAAEAARLGIDLTAGLTFAEQALLTPTFPLTLNGALTASARGHSADMAAEHFFEHTSPGGFNPTYRAQAAGYAGTAGENIGAGYATVDALYRAWMDTPSERRNILSLYSNFDANYRYDDLGMGVALNVPGAAYPSYYTADFGNPTPASRAPQLSGVVFTDTNGDDFYTIGEGLAAIRIDAFAGTSTTGTPVATYTTDAAGNYQFPLPSGSYTVVFTQASDNTRVVKAVSISGQNAKLDAKAAELAPPPPPPDDHANAGQWNLASTIAINPSTGDGGTSGTLGIPGDSDIFTFTAAKTGTHDFYGLPLGAAFSARIRIYNAAQSLIATGSPLGVPTNAKGSAQLAAGATYFIVIDAGITGGTGDYVLLVRAPLPPPPPPDDFASSGEWSQAAPIAIDPDIGSGARSGQIEAGADSDLFTFTAPRSGSTTLSSLVTGGTLTARIRLYDAGHTLIATGDAGASPANSIIAATLTGGQTYFLLVDSLNNATGSYSVQVVGPAAPPPDDYANAGEWSLAAALSVDSASGNASITGRIEVGGDADLFAFIAAKAGPTTISALISSGALSSRIRMYDADHALIATGIAGSNSLDSIATATLTLGQRYYILVDSADPSATGDYTVWLLAPTVPPIPPQYLDASGEPVNPVYINTKPTLAFINQQGRPVIAVRSASGSWSLTDLQATTNSPNGVTSLISWLEPRDGLLYAAAATPSGLILFKLAPDNTWSFRNITAEVRVSRPIVSNLATFVDNSGLRQIGGLTAEGHLVSYWMTGLLWPQGWRYYYTDLATRDLTLRGHAQPALSSNFVTYVTQKNSLNYVTTDPAGNVILFFRPGGGLATQLWNWANLSQITGAPPVVGNITAAETSGRVVNISGTDASGNLWMITWRFGEGWRSRNVTGATSSGGSVPLATGTVTSWINSAGAGFVAGLTTGGDIVLYRYTFTGGQSTWTFATLSAGVAGATALAGPLRTTTLDGGAILIAGATSSGQIVRTTFAEGAGGGWIAENVTELLMP